MKFCFNLIIFILIEFSYSNVPLWKINESGIELNQSSIKELFYLDKIDGKKSIKFIKKIKGNNTIIINNKNISVPWEDIDSFYFFRNGKFGKYFICPKANYLMQEYDFNSNHLIEKSNNKINEVIKNNDFFELKCNFNNETNWIYNGFINMNNKKHHTLWYQWTDGGWYGDLNLNNSLFDFIWIRQSTNENYLYGIFGKNRKMVLQLYNITIDHSQNPHLINYSNEELELGNISKYSYAYFDNEMNIFYWLNCDDTLNFRSGYSEEVILNITNITNLKIKTNTDSPLQFFRNAIINNISFIRNTRFVYYNISVNNNKTIYYGLIDIKEIYVIFNTNEALEEFKPYTNYSMLAIINSTAFEICVKKKGNQCVRGGERANSNFIIIIFVCFLIVKISLISFFGYKFFKRKKEIQELDKNIKKINDELQQCRTDSFIE